MCNLSIREITVKNYRKFELEEYALNPRMNVFAGKNGSGKTALLEASCVILGAYLAAFKTYVPSRFVFNISKEDSHIKTQIAEDKAILTTGGIRQYPCEVSCKVAWEHQDNIIEFHRVLFKEDGRTKFDGSNPMQPTVVKWENQIAQASHLDETQIFPLVLYLSSARLWNETKSSSRLAKVFSRTEAYTRCLDAKHGMDLAFEYIQQLQSIAIEENNGESYAAYNAILEAINVALQDELKTDEQVIFSTRFGKDIVALKQKDGTVIPFTTLSDGYRNVIKIILDIATRMCILNPYLKGDALVQTPGVVIIDEIDLSLHPTWQKRIIGILKNLFPKIQFICATHSPFIIQSLEADELITLDRGEKPCADEYVGESIEDIAEEIMGVEMPQYSEKKIKMFEAANRFYDALGKKTSKSDVEALRQEMVRLEAEYDDNPAYLAWIRQKYTAKKLEVESK
jgi:predicted ATP-binding protein involved in virulence